MGLDITVYPTYSPLQPHLCDKANDDPESTWEACYEKLNHRHVYAYRGFEQSYRGLPDSMTHEHVQEGRTTLIGNMYVEVDTSTSWGFRAGSYSGYGQWRNLLANFAYGVDVGEVFNNPDEYRDKPFFELINFADNEGCIGPEAAADLARDFDQNEDEAEQSFIQASSDDTDRWFMEMYRTWQKACHDAADTGFIDFH